MIEALKGHPNYGGGEDDWVEGWGYDESKLAERRTPTTEDLDKVSATQPVYVLRSDCHSGVCNARALELAGITRDTPDPEGGRFGRYEDSEPNGALVEHGANDVVLNAKGVQDYPHEVAKLAATTDHFAERGIVAITDMMVFKEPYDDLEVYRDARAEGLKQQAVLYYDWAALTKDPIGDLTDGHRSGRVKLGGIKLFLDGSVSNRTAWTKDACPDSDDHGMSTLSDDAILAGYEWASRNKVQMAFHAMGDRALEHIIVDLLADNEPWMDGDVPSVRLEHATLLDRADQAGKRGEDGLRRGDPGHLLRRVRLLRPEPLRGPVPAAYPVKTFYDNLDRVALSSDAPATTWADPDDVFVSSKAAASRKAYNGADIVREEAITVPMP
jgi:predicted amidohydrolase YtcJ